MKLFNLSLFILFLFIGTSSTLWAADTSQEPTTYHSSLDDYKPLSDDNLSNWKSINVPSNGSGHAGHSMPNMQHKMTPEQMANMPSDSKETPDMAGMDHSNMQGMEKASPDKMKSMDHSKMEREPDMQPMPGMDHSNIQGMEKASPDKMKSMDHSQMKHEHDMPPMAGMDHSKMVGMDHENMKSMPKSKSATQPMKKEEMQEMDHSQMSGHDHNGADLKGWTILK